MYLLVMFDLPTQTDKDKKSYCKFRKDLLGNGFTMIQYSCYVRICKSDYSANSHIDFIIKNLPKNGEIRILKLTSNVYNNMLLFNRGEVDKGTNEEKLMIQTVIEF